MNKEVPNIDEDTAFQTAVKPVNGCGGSNGLLSTLLVLGALPRFGLSSVWSSLYTIEQSIAIRKATSKESRPCTRQVRGAL